MANKIYTQMLTWQLNDSGIVSDDTVNVSAVKSKVVQSKTVKSNTSSETVTEVNLLLNTVDTPIAQVVFAHGAGANMQHEFMEEITTLLNNENINVLRFNFPFMDKRALTGKRYPPDRMPKLLTCYQQVIEQYIAQIDNSIPLVIGGKSMGSRVAATLLSEESIKSNELLDNIDGVFCIGYPFHPAKKPEKLRLEPLMESIKPILIVQGDRDTLGNEAEIISYKLPANCRCVFLEDGDHSLKPRVKSGHTYPAHKIRAVTEIVNFIKSLS